MKKIYKFTTPLIAIIFLAVSAQAQEYWPTKSTISQANAMPDESIVVLEGELVQKVKDEHYLLRDSTGTIVVEIDDDDWYGAAPRMGQKIRVFGEVDTHRYRPTDIDVKRVEIIN